MRYKVVPAPADADLLFAARDAVPLVPGSVEDCCTRIREMTDVPARDEAREWLTFLEALALVEETDRGYYRIREEPDRDALAEAFRQRVFPAEEVLDALRAADEPLDAASAFERVRDVVPRWERDRREDWESEWRDRVRLVLEWGVVFGRVQRVDGGYRPAGGHDR